LIFDEFIYDLFAVFRQVSFFIFWHVMICKILPIVVYYATEDFGFIHFPLGKEIFFVESKYKTA